MTSELNYLLQKLYFVQYMSPGDLNPLDSPLKKEDLEQIYLTDGKLVFNGQRLGKCSRRLGHTLYADEKFAKERKELEDSRDALMQDIQEKGHASKESGERM